jgi:hypothetical protein
MSKAQHQAGFELLTTDGCASLSASGPFPERLNERLWRSTVPSCPVENMRLAPWWPDGAIKPSVRDRLVALPGRFDSDRLSAC